MQSQLYVYKSILLGQLKAGNGNGRRLSQLFGMLVKFGLQFYNAISNSLTQP